MNRSCRNLFTKYLIFSTAAVLLFTLSACKSKPKEVSSVGLLSSRNVVPPPYSAPFTPLSATSRTTQSPIEPIEAEPDFSSFDQEPLPSALPTEQFSSVTPVIVPDDQTFESETISPTVRPQPAPVTKTPSRVPTPPSTANLPTYKVQKGDTMSGIALAAGVKWQDIAALNPNVNPNRMRIGENLYLPSHAKDKPVVVAKRTATVSKKSTVTSSKSASRGANAVDGVYTVVAGDSIWTISRRFKVSGDEIREWNNLKTDKLVIGQKLKIKKNAEIITKSTSKAASKTTVEPATVELPSQKEPEVQPILDEKSLEEIKLELDVQGPINLLEEELTIDPGKKMLKHEVISGNTLKSIAELYAVTIEKILEENPDIKSDDDLKIGTEIKIVY